MFFFIIKIKIMKKEFLFVVTMLLLLTTACKKKDNPPPTPPAPQKTRVVKADFSAVAGVYTYTYNAAGNIATETFTSTTTGNPSRVITFTNYDLLGRITEYVTDFNDVSITDSKSIISYNSNGKIERLVYFDFPSGVSAGYTAMEYTGLKVIVKRYSLANAFLGSTEYTLTSDGNNIAEQKNYNAANVLQATTTFSNYDNKNTYESLLPAGYFTVPVSKNNFQTLSRTNNVTGAVTTFTATFEYNADGYPTKRTFGSGVSTYEYTKQ